MDSKTLGALRRYLAEIPNLPNESAKTHRFVELLAELFPGSSAVTEFVGGFENLIHIDTTAGKKRRRIDTYYGNAVIEFEKSLKATEETAKKQLREHAIGVWAREGAPRRPLLCIASDGIIWKTFVPRVREGVSGKPKPEDVELDLLRTLVVTEETLRDFWIWLTSFLFREARTVPSADRFRVDFGAASLAFAEAREALRRAWKAVAGISEPRVAFETWKKYLMVTYGQLDTDLEPLFLKHTYLVSVARLLIWASLSRGKVSGSLRDVAGDVLSGKFFATERIENLVEDDFFQWVRQPKAEASLAPVWERALDQMLTYDLTRLEQDILKGVYQELIDPKDRHDLGEYYTPDWLCERIVAELLPPRGFASVLDPTCGSGSFLRATIVHQLNVNPRGGDAGRLRAVLENVVGIDIHPVAVTIARATYLLAIRSLLQATKRPVQIPVYLADSLFLPSEVSQRTLGLTPTYEIRFGGDKKVFIPEELVQNPEFFDPAVSAAADVAIDHAASGKESEKRLQAYLARRIPALMDQPNVDQTVSALWSFTAGLTDLIRRHRNSIWAFIVRNSYRPAMMRERFDFILGNPPWLSYRYIADPEYQAEVKRLAVDEYRIAPRSQKLITQMELATVFLVHALTTFGKAGSQLGFVMPRSVLTADQHANLRTREYTAPVKLEAYWDLAEVSPLFNVPACVLFGTKPKGTFNPRERYTLEAHEWEGRLPARDMPWAAATPFLKVRRKTGGVIYLGSRTAISTKAGRTKPNEPSTYTGHFRQGATILPRNFYFVRVRELTGTPDPDRIYWAETDPEQAQEAKPPYDRVRLSGNLEGRFLFGTALSKHLLPFLPLPPPVIAIPVVRTKDGLEVKTADELKAEGYREFARWMAKAEKIWNEKRERKAERQTLYERLDYQRELTAQGLEDPYLVLYNAAGTNLSAATVNRRELSLPFVVEHKLYWAGFRSREEADYLTAILNAGVVNEEIKPFQSQGLLGERDIEKKVLELPIPVFDSRDADHRTLAALAREAHDRAASFMAAQTLPRGLGSRRAIIREAVAVPLDSIDNLVQSLLALR